MNKKIFAFVALPFLAILVITLQAQDTNLTPVEAWTIAEQRLGNAIVHYNAVKGERDNIHTKWEINSEEIRDATVSSLVDVVFGGVDPIGGLKNAFGTSLNAGLDIDEDIILTSLLDTSISAAETWYAEVLAKESNRNEKYQTYLQAWYAANPNYAQSPSGPKPESKIWTVPEKKDLLFVCQGNCSDEMTSPSGAQSNHLRWWYHIGKHKWYSEYDCPSVSYDDWLLCRGGCGVYLPRLYHGALFGYGDTPMDGSHTTYCREAVPWSITKFLGECDTWYYSCNGQPCSESDNHIDDDDSSPPTGSTPPAPAAPTDHTPNCQDCTSDCSSPCSCTNSGTCGGTVSTPPSGSQPPSPEPPAPPEPASVLCSTCNGTYNPADASDRSYHKDYQNCVNWGCSVAFLLCSPELSGPCVPGYSAHSAGN